MIYNTGMIIFMTDSWFPIILCIVIVLIWFYIAFHLTMGYFTLFIQFLFYFYIEGYLFYRTLDHKE